MLFHWPPICPSADRAASRAVDGRLDPVRELLPAGRVRRTSASAWRQARRAAFFASPQPDGEQRAGKRQEQATTRGALSRAPMVARTSDVERLVADEVARSPRRGRARRRSRRARGRAPRRGSRRRPARSRACRRARPAAARARHRADRRRRRSSRAVSRKISGSSCSSASSSSSSSRTSTTGSRCWWS